MTNEGKVNILLVDDRPENLLVLKATLGSLNQNLVEAKSGHEALKYILEQEFAVILLDVMMPGMDGFETAKLIRERERSRHTPIIFVTAMLRDDADAFKGYSVGAVDYIMKPFQPEILRSKVSVFVDLFKKTEEVKRQAELIRQIEQREFAAKLSEAERLTELERERVKVEQQTVKAILQHAPLGFARLDSNGHLTEMNELFATQFDLDQTASISKNLFSLIAWLPENLKSAVLDNKPCQISEQLVKNFDDRVERERFCDITAWPVRNLNDDNIGTVIIALDVSERVKLDRQRKDFVGTLAHDLQTPVIASDRAIGLILGKLANVAPADTITLLTMLKQNNENLLHMIQGLLDIYHYEAGSQALYFDEVDLKLLAAACIDELQPLAAEQGLTLSGSIDTHLEPIAADRTAIRRVLTNLIDNAIKFTPSGGSITVRVFATGEQAVLEVEDTGVGIAADDRAHLFERFWHNNRLKTFKNSNGLGLYLCKQIINSHHGAIECESTVGSMTLFRVTLPIKAPVSAVLAKQSEMISPTSGVQ